jgi:hypothetical protein
MNAISISREAVDHIFRELNIDRLVDKKGTLSEYDPE